MRQRPDARSLCPREEQLRRCLISCCYGRRLPLKRDGRFLEDQQPTPDLAGDAAQVTQTDDLCCGWANGNGRPLCRPLNRPDPGKHQLFCNPERRAVAFIANLAAA
jgi:hypothetical protein